MTKKQIGLLIAVLGVALALVSVLGDTLGIGSAESKFGWKQVAGLVAGGALAAGGAFLWFGEPAREGRPGGSGQGPSPGAGGGSGPGPGPGQPGR